MGVAASTICSLLYLQEPSNKRVRPLARVTSLANLISPVRNGAVRRFGQTIQVKAEPSSPRSLETWGRYWLCGSKTATGISRHLLKISYVIHAGIEGLLGTWG